MRARILTFIAALIALAVMSTPASAAPKKPQLIFGQPSYTVVEGNTTANLTVSRTGNVTTAVSVNWATSAPPSAAATAGTDYTSASGTLQFAAGQTSKPIAIPILDDADFDPNEGIRVTLSGATAGAQIKAPNPVLVTIVDNDGPGTLDFSSPTYSSVEGAGVATFTVTRQGASNIAVSVGYAVNTGSATVGADYTPQTGTLNFGVGQMTKTFQVPITDDTLGENPETVIATLSNPQNLADATRPPAIGPNNPATLTIRDDDVSVFSFSSSFYSVLENAGTQTVTVNRTGAVNLPASVHYATANGTATGADYTSTSGDLSFAAGEASKTFPVTILNDGVTEGNETIDLRLTPVGGGATLASSSINIVDNDNPKPNVQLSNIEYSATEAGSIAVTASLSHAVDGDVTVDLATADDPGASANSATAGSDYTDSDQTLTFRGNLNPAMGGTGETSKTVLIPTSDDSEVEGDETLIATLSNVNSVGTLGSPSSATLTITDDDLTGDLEFDALRYDVDETGDHATVTVRRVGGSSGTVSVDYWTDDAGATAPGDYTATNGTLTFAAGEVQKTFSVPVNWDGENEADETVALNLGNPGGGAELATNVSAVLHIADSGASGPVQFSASSYSVAESGLATVTVTRTGNLGGPVTVDYATADGTAVGGTDYTPTSGTLTFGPGQATRSFQVPVTGDSADEPDETIGLTLSNAAGGTSLGSPATAVLTIADDDAAAPTPTTPTTTDTPAQTPTTHNTTVINQTTQVVAPTTGTKTPLKLSVKAKATQKALKTKVLVLTVKSSQAAKLAANAVLLAGKKKISLGRKTLSVKSGKLVTIKIKLSKAALKKLRKAAAKRAAKISLSVSAADPAGNKAAAAAKILAK